MSEVYIGDMEVRHNEKLIGELRDKCSITNDPLERMRIEREIKHLEYLNAPAAYPLEVPTIIIVE